MILNARIIGHSHTMDGNLTIAMLFIITCSATKQLLMLRMAGELLICAILAVVRSWHENVWLIIKKLDYVYIYHNIKHNLSIFKYSKH